MIKKLMMLLQLLFLSIILTACGSSSKIVEVPKIVEKIVIVKPKIPGELLECKNFTIKRPGQMQSDIAEFQTDLLNVALDCKSKLQKVKNSLNK